MTQRVDFERQMADYLERRSTSRAPTELLDATMARIETTRQRPGWLILDRWVSARRQGGVTRAAKVALVVATVGLLVALSIAIGLFVGPGRPPAPPFGLARPGLIAFDLAGDIYIANPDGTGRTQLTSGADQDTHATYSPDGTRIAFVTQLADLSTSLVVMNDDGGGRLTLAEHLVEVGDIAWSPDSRSIAFGSRLVGDSSFHIFVARIDHPGAIRLGTPDVTGIEPSWSPAGTKIAFKHLDSCCGTASLWLMGADGSNPHELVTGVKASSFDWDSALWNTAWSPDGTRLAFLAADDVGVYDVYIVGADGRGLVDISRSPVNESWPSWSPDGTRIAYARLLNNPDNLDNAGMLTVVASDGSNPVGLPGPLVNRSAPVWSPDGRHILGYAYNEGRGVSNALAVFDASGRTDAVLVPEAGLSGESSTRPFSNASWQRLAP